MFDDYSFPAAIKSVPSGVPGEGGKAFMAPLIAERHDRQMLERKWCRARGQWLRSSPIRQRLCWIFVAGVLMFCSVGRAQRHVVTSPLAFSTTDPRLQRSFDWAKQQALAYASSGEDPVGDWYEAALPGRNAFCMRDVSHQAMGAQALGLSAENKNMLSRFARAVSASRDWAGYWEIDRDGNPSSADYASDDDFWYNLPANFEVMSAALRMYAWTGDSAYINDPVFLNFYSRTVTHYVHQWQLEPDKVLSRPRIMNRRRDSGKFVESRGIPGYTENRKDFNVGTDL